MIIALKVDCSLSPACGMVRELWDPVGFGPLNTSRETDCHQTATEPVLAHFLLSCPGIPFLHNSVCRLKLCLLSQLQYMFSENSGELDVNAEARRLDRLWKGSIKARLVSNGLIHIEFKEMRGWKGWKAYRNIERTCCLNRKKINKGRLCQKIKVK